MKKKDIPEDRARYAKMTKEECLQAFKRTIAHPHLEAADQALREAIQETGGASLVNVFGPARVGKSTMKNHVIRTITLEMLPLLEQDRERVPLLSLMPRPPLSGSFSWKDFFQDGLVAFDEPLIDHKIALDTEDDEGQTGVARLDESRRRRKPPEGTKDALRQSFERAAKRRRPVAIFIDEAQHLGTVSGMRLDIHFPRYRSTEKELSQFKNVLRTFQDALPFVEESEILLKHWEFCYERSIGCVGNLRLMLVRAIHAALWANAKTLSWKQLKTHAFSEAESYEMMLEAYEGESELASKPNQRAKLLKMLGLAPHIKTKKVPQPDVPQAEDTASGVETTQPGQSDKIAKGVEQELTTPEVLVDEASSELQPVSDDRSDETSDGTEEGIKADDTPSSGTPSKPSKKPRAEPIRPFRRKNTRDRTGGFRRENKGRD